MFKKRYKTQRSATTRKLTDELDHSTFAQRLRHLTSQAFISTNITTPINFTEDTLTTNAKQLSSPQSIAQAKNLPYDSKGAAYYICSVIVVYALAIVLLVVSLTKRKRKDHYQPANQRSTNDDYYVNIKKDPSLESSGNRFENIFKLEKFLIRINLEYLQ